MQIVPAAAAACACGSLRIVTPACRRLPCAGRGGRRRDDRAAPARRGRARGRAPAYNFRRARLRPQDRRDSAQRDGRHGRRCAGATGPARLLAPTPAGAFPSGWRTTQTRTWRDHSWSGPCARPVRMAKHDRPRCVSRRSCAPPVPFIMYLPVLPLRHEGRADSAKPLSQFARWFHFGKRPVEQATAKGSRQTIRPSVSDKTSTAKAMC